MAIIHEDHRGGGKILPEFLRTVVSRSGASRKLLLSGGKILWERACFRAMHISLHLSAMMGDVTREHAWIQGVMSLL